ncbi:MAG: cell division protein FtsQ/DivIB [Gammaproteobacteria bacterium]
MLMAGNAVLLGRKTPVQIVQPVNWLRWGVTLTVFVLSMALLVLSVNWLVDPVHSPLRSVKIEGEFKFIDKTQLQTTLTPLLENGFFKVSVAEIQGRAEAMPWVSQASVRRLWPDRLQINIVEQQPFARWGEQAFLNARGEVFTPVAQTAGLQLPLFSGPQGHANQVLVNYKRMGDMLKGLGLVIDELHQDSRRAWRLKLSNGMAVELGRTDPVKRLARFINVYPTILAAKATAVIEQVDLRYSNGFAVRWSQPVSDEETG